VDCQGEGRGIAFVRGQLVYIHGRQLLAGWLAVCKVRFEGGGQKDAKLRIGLRPLMGLSLGWKTGVLYEVLGTFGLFLKF
jgi:hypothetical protein